MNRSKVMIIVISLVILLLLSIILVLIQKFETVEIVNAQPTEINIKGIWISTVYRLDYPSAGTTNDALLKKDVSDAIRLCQETGINTIFFQVRPAADALYKSSIFPWSKYLTSSQGVAPKNNFDPLEYFIGQAHGAGIALHAWINPYRVTASVNDTLISDHIALSDSEFTVNHLGKLYFNPGVPKVRQLIIDGVNEILENYCVDGIHYDDYFYPDSNFDDTASYLKYNKSFKNIDDWRRNNNDMLIFETHELINSFNLQNGTNIIFGVSPGGIWANKNKNSLGSNTNGLQTYYDNYADTRLWVKNGWLDYIAPQIYWNIGYTAADYEVLIKWWANVTDNTNVELIIGQAAYKVNDSTQNAAWQGVDEISRQLELNKTIKQISGVIIFRYLNIKNNLQLKNTYINFFIEEVTTEINNVQVVEELINQLVLSEITLADEVKIITARIAYNNLNEEQKLSVSNINKLIDSEIKLAQLKSSALAAANYSEADKVIKKIDSIPLVVDISHEALITSARAAYNQLNDTIKALVTNADKLTASEAVLVQLKGTDQAAADKLASDRAKADNVIAKINTIPVIVDVSDESLLTSVRMEYEQLSVNQKMLVSNYTKLEEAELMFGNLIKDISITTLPDKVYYKIGDEIDLTGIIAIVLKQNQQTITISADDLIVEEFDSSQSGLTIVTVSYEQVNGYFTAYVQDKIIDTELPPYNKFIYLYIITVAIFLLILNVIKYRKNILIQTGQAK